MNHKKTLFSIIALSFFIFSSIAVFAQESDTMMMGGDEEMEMVMDDGNTIAMHDMDMGPLIANRMLHAWVSLVASIVIFFLALKYMTGGKLSQPIMLIGFGALGDALLGLIPPAGEHMKWMWLGALIFSTSVVFGIIWMAKIFGVFVKKTPQP